MKVPAVVVSNINVTMIDVANPALCGNCIKLTAIMFENINPELRQMIIRGSIIVMRFIGANMENNNDRAKPSKSVKYPM